MIASAMEQLSVTSCNPNPNFARSEVYAPSSKRSSTLYKDLTTVPVQQVTCSSLIHNWVCCCNPMSTPEFWGNQLPWGHKRPKLYLFAVVPGIKWSVLNFKSVYCHCQYVPQYFIKYLQRSMHWPCSDLLVKGSKSEKTRGFAFLCPPKHPFAVVYVHHGLHLKLKHRWCLSSSSILPSLQCYSFTGNSVLGQ